METREYGEWNIVVEDAHASSFDAYIVEAFGSLGTDGFDFAAIKSEYASAINAALPDSVSLNGSVFYGPAHDADKNFDGYPLGEDGNLDINAIVQGIDFWAIVEKHGTEN